MAEGLYYPTKSYWIILRDEDALPNVTPQGKMAPGTRAIKRPSGRSWLFTGSQWEEEISTLETQQAQILVELKAIRGLLESWNSKETEGG